PHEPHAAPLAPEHDGTVVVTVELVGVVLDVDAVVNRSGRSRLPISCTNASISCSIAAASPVLRQPLFFSARRNAAANASSALVRHAGSGSTLLICAVS